MAWDLELWVFIFVVLKIINSILHTSQTMMIHIKVIIGSIINTTSKTVSSYEKLEKNIKHSRKQQIKKYIYDLFI